MKAYVIKRDDGKYLSTDHNTVYHYFYWGNNLLNCCHFDTKEFATDFLQVRLQIEKHLGKNRFDNCKVVPVEIKECINE